MEYQIEIVDPDELNLLLVTDAVHVFDPAAVVDYDAGHHRLRVAAALSPPVLVDLLNTAGLVVRRQQVHAQPSECCGGCGG